MEGWKVGKSEGWKVGRSEDSRCFVVSLSHKCTRDKCTLPTIPLGPAGRRPARALMMMMMRMIAEMKDSDEGHPLFERPDGVSEITRIMCFNFSSSVSLVNSNRIF